MYELRLLWDELLRHVDRRARAAVAPFTTGGNLDLSSPHIVGTLPAAHGGTGGTAGSGAREPLVMGGELLLLGGDVITIGV